MPIEQMRFYTRADIRARPDDLFAFGDNLENRGFGGQAKEARGEPNAVGIPTKRAPSMATEAFLTDFDRPVVFRHWRNAFGRINQHLAAGGLVVWPSDGIGTGRAELKERAPVLWADLQLFIAGMRATASAYAERDE